MGHGPDPQAGLPLGPGEDAHAETVLIAEQPGMDEERFSAVFMALRTEARDYNDRLAPSRVRALRQYNGEPQGDEEPGRSAVVLTDVHDTIAAVMPSVMRVFAGAENPVEFEPHSDGDEAAAGQATDYVQHVVFNECDGFRAIHDATLDAFTLKAGWVRWWWDTAIRVTSEHYTGLLEPQCAALITQPGVRAMRVTRRPATEEERIGLDGSPEAQMVQSAPGVPLLLFDVTLTRRNPRNAVAVGAVPSESVWIDPDASGPHDARGLFIVREVGVSDLVALGIPEQLIVSRISEPAARRNDMVTRRRDRRAAMVSRSAPPDPALRRLTYTEGWIRVDYDGDGIAELRHVQAIGDNGQDILAHGPASEIPLSRITPFYVPHKAIGESYADRTGDLQVVNTRIMRNILDSMTESIHPRTVIKDGAVPVDDVLNTEMGAVIREREAGAVRELTKPFIGPAALPLLDVTAAIRESRTGITRGSQGLTAESLQSTAPIAVSAQLSAAQDRIELVLRCIAEGLKPLYSGVLGLMCAHQDRTRVVRLRGKWTPVDPRPWMAGFNVVVRVGVGHGSSMDRVATFGAIAQKQEQILETLGPNNPLVTIGQYSNTLADMMGAAGIANTSRYFKPVPLDWKPPPPPQKPSPDELLAQVEVMKSNNSAAGDAAQTRQRTQQMLLDDDRQRDQARVDALLKAAELQGKYPGTQLDFRAISALLNRDPELTMALSMPHDGSTAPLIPPIPDGTASPAAPGNSLADARMFLPPNLITALATAERAGGATPGGAVPGGPA
jgi:hypothetical protein